jgi:hypothetical protein
MRISPVALLGGALSLGAALAGLAFGEGGPGPVAPGAKPPPPPPGIHWEPDLDAAFERALREGRPILLAVNALEDESANVRLATQLYPSAPWGEATRGFVCLVANPNDHPGPSGRCARYPGTTCATHKAVLARVLKDFGPELISPQHLVLDPEGDLAYRKEYYTGEVSPALLESWLSRLTPALAYRRAAIGRKAKVAALVGAKGEELLASAEAWLAQEDGLATAGVVNALDETQDAGRRAILIRALGRGAPRQAPVCAHAAEERVLYPDDEPEETRLFCAALLASDRPLGVWAATRAIARSTDAGLRADVLKALCPSGRWQDLPRNEQVLVLEALLLAGDAAAGGEGPADLDDEEAARLDRARTKGGRATPRAPRLEEALARGRPGSARRALLEASEAQVRESLAKVTDAFARAPYLRVRVAAALALLRARVATEGLVDFILTALLDPLEGDELRAGVVEALGEDPGRDPATVRAALERRLGGGG